MTNTSGFRTGVAKQVACKGVQLLRTILASPLAFTAAHEAYICRDALWDTLLLSSDPVALAHLSPKGPVDQVDFCDGEGQSPEALGSGMAGVPGMVATATGAEVPGAGG